MIDEIVGANGFFEGSGGNLAIPHRTTGCSLLNSTIYIDELCTANRIQELEDASSPAWLAWYVYESNYTPLV